jgi:hypothetical protein
MLVNQSLLTLNVEESGGCPSNLSVLSEGGRGFTPAWEHRPHTPFIHPNLLDEALVNFKVRAILTKRWSVSL